MFSIKRTIVLCAVTMLTFQAKSQENFSLEKGNVLINPSITLGWYNYGYGLDIVNIIPPVALNVEYAPSSYFSFGVEAEYGQRKYRDFGYVLGSYEYKYDYKGLMLRGSFHYLEILKELLGEHIGKFNSEKLDFYIGISSGVLVTSYTRKWREVLGGPLHQTKNSSMSFKFGYMAGFRYYFSKRFAAFTETGRNSLGWAKVGLTLKI